MGGQVDVHRRDIPGQPLKFGDVAVTFVVDTSAAILGYEALIALGIQEIVYNQQKNRYGDFMYRLYGAGYYRDWLRRRPLSISGSHFCGESITLSLCYSLLEVYEATDRSNRNVVVVIRFNRNDDSEAVACDKQTKEFCEHSVNQVLYVGLNHDTNIASSRYGIPKSHTLICGVDSFRDAMRSCDSSISRLRALADIHNCHRAFSVTAFDTEDRRKAFPMKWRGNREYHNKIGKLDEYNNQVNWKLNGLHSRFAV